MRPRRTRKQPRLSRTELERAKTTSPCSQKMERASAPREQRSTPVFLERLSRATTSARATEVKSPVRTGLLDMQPPELGHSREAAPGCQRSSLPCGTHAAVPP